MPIHPQVTAFQHPVVTVYQKLTEMGTDEIHLLHGKAY